VKTSAQRQKLQSTPKSVSFFELLMMQVLEHFRIGSLDAILLLRYLQR